MGGGGSFFREYWGFLIWPLMSRSRCLNALAAFLAFWHSSPARLNPVYKRAQGLTETAMLRHWLSMLLRMPLIHLNLIGVLVGFQSCFKCILVGEKKVVFHRYAALCSTGFKQ